LGKGIKGNKNFYKGRVALRQEMDKEDHRKYDV